jgi:para-aminobenzoate synthetase/4-amino-4-deoxychorismate lyase
MIHTLESDQRGAYCGALGLLTGERSVFSLPIRTAARSAQGWVYGVGSGIVYDSDPQAELDELRVKLGALIASSAG